LIDAASVGGFSFYGSLVRCQPLPLGSHAQQGLALHWVLCTFCEKSNPKDEATGRRRRKHFQWLTTNIGYPKLREHLGAVVAIMKLSADWHDFRAKLDKLYPRIGKPTQLSLDFADEEEHDTGKGL
jgi:hypothetical protein